MYFLFVLTTDFSMFKKEFHFKNSFKMGCARKRLRSVKFHTFTIATSFVATASNLFNNNFPREGGEGGFLWVQIGSSVKMSAYSV